ncbi:zinc-binding dehydrogenase [Chryseobacterium gotjawalense]|uniref:alcohol dehydrogenase n=1 Tax=Chryseobacterium gotjawalense TaxID=3042315 RepID=A0ABY8RE27_9FLAO|nr:zinc-binding dehydrogenase [Chryseobacterium sp. wdc7]WHF52232.1 zinc-binding dehydrogenase [Chryseobacterium sp. wdc7]
MKGWKFTKTHVPIELIEKPDPVAAPGEVVIDIKASGLCHSDVGALEDEGWMHIITAAPLIFGHECAGVISEVGQGVEGYKIGDRVGVAPIHPETGAAIGYQRDGGYATKLSVPAVQLVPMPAGVTFAQGAAATDAGMTSYHAIFRTGGAKAGMKIGIIGIGGLGQFGARAAIAEGAEVYAVDLSPEARELAMEMGCREVFDKVMDLEPVGCQLIVDFAGFGTTTAEAIEAIAPDGTVVQVGMGKLESTINTRTLILKRVTLRGSQGGDGQDIANVYRLMAEGKLDADLTEIKFEEVAEGLERLHKGGVKGRLVAIQD